MVFRSSSNINKIVCLEVTNKCGLNCSHCSSNSSIEKDTFLDLVKIKEILNQLADLGFNEISLSGGNPLIHPNIFEIISIAKQLSFYVTCYTSGNLYSEREKKVLPLCKELYNKLEKSGLDKIIFSIHGIQEQTHQNLTKTKGSYCNLIESLNNSNHNYSFTREVNFVIMKENIDDLFKIVPFLKRFNLNNIHLLRFVPHGRGFINRGSLEIFDDNIITLVRNFIRRFNDEIGISLSSSIPILEHTEKIKCRAGIDKICITPNGLVYPCVALKNLNLNGDNSIYSDSLDHILENSNVFKFMESIHKADHHYMCHLNCPAQKIIKEQMI